MVEGLLVPAQGLAAERQRCPLQPLQQLLEKPGESEQQREQGQRLHPSLPFSERRWTAQLVPQVLVGYARPALLQLDELRDQRQTSEPSDPVVGWVLQRRAKGRRLQLARLALLLRHEAGRQPRQVSQLTGPSQVSRRKALLPPLLPSAFSPHWRPPVQLRISHEQISCLVRVSSLATY